jgi:hypothetical protein
MPTYTYIFADLRTNTVIDELPLYGVSMARDLNQYGDWTASVTLDREGKDDAHVKAATEPGRTILYVDRDGTIVYSGILWTRTYQAQSKSLQFTGQDLRSYFVRRLISSRFSQLVFAGVDQLTIAQSLLNQAQALGSIGITVPTNFSGVLRDRTYVAAELKPVAEAIQQLSEVINGFDWDIYAQYGGGMIPQKLALFGAPYLGLSPQATTLVFEYPGDIANYWWSENVAESASTFWTTGKGDGDTTLISVADDNTYVNAGYPVLEGSKSFVDVSEPATLFEHAQQGIKDSRVPFIAPTVTLASGAVNEPGDYALGDHARFRINDPWSGGQIERIWRIMGWRLTPPSSETEETVDLTVGQAYDG